MGITEAIGDYNYSQTYADGYLRQLERQQYELSKLRGLYQQIMQEQQTPFEQSEEFRDFIVWLCGFTDRAEPPPQEDWDKLKDQTMKMAAKFALAVRKWREMEPPLGSYADQAEKATTPLQGELKLTPSAFSP